MVNVAKSFIWEIGFCRKHQILLERIHKRIIREERAKERTCLFLEESYLQRADDFLRVPK